MAKYDLSSQRAIADAAEEVEKERLRLHEVGFQTGKYAWHETNYLYAYGQALKDCAKGLEPLQRLLDDVLNYLGEHMDSSELRRMFFEDMGMSEEDVAFLGFDLDEEYEELDGEVADISDVEYMVDFGNGFRIQKVFANQMPDGGYGDIYDFPSDVRKEHPGARIMIGYCVVDIGAGIVPHGCNDWNNTVAEAEADYEENVVPYLDEEFDEISMVEYVKDLGNGYQIQKVFANKLPDGGYGDVYNSPEDVEEEHPESEVMVGYCVVDIVDGMIPMACRDWNDTVEEAIADYEEHVPLLDPMCMVVESWEEMQKKYPMDREDMTEEEERAFVEDCFKLYEQEGFSPRFWSPYEDNAKRIGQKVEIIGRCTIGENRSLEAALMWMARFEDGSKIEVFPEEVVPSEMKANGCNWPAHMFMFEQGSFVDEVLDSAKRNSAPAGERIKGEGERECEIEFK